VYFSRDKGLTWFWLERVPARDVDDLYFDEKSGRMLVTSRSSPVLYSIDPASLTFTGTTRDSGCLWLGRRGLRFAASLQDGIVLMDSSFRSRVSSRDGGYGLLKARWRFGESFCGFRYHSIRGLICRQNGRRAALFSDVRPSAGADCGEGAGGERLSFDDGVALYGTSDVLAVGWLANHVRERMHGDVTYFNVNRHINPTNVCVAACRLCAFGRKKGDPAGYTMALDEAFETAASGYSEAVTEFHIVGGLHPDLPFEYFLDLVAG
jgi:hypothetical protein